jgi:golgi-specific brefeldin A-resistance guanine nucleotide exchange factor 1
LRYDLQPRRCVCKDHVGISQNHSHAFTYSDRELPLDALEWLVNALLDELPDDESSAVPVISVKSDSAPSTPANGGEPPVKKPVYDPKVAYILELCTVLALRDGDTVERLGKAATKALQAIIRDSARFHSSLVSRAVFYQFHILKASYVGRPQFCASSTANGYQDHDFVRAPVLLHTVSSFPKDTLTKTSQLVLQGLKLCIDQPGPLRSEIMTSPDFWVILRTLGENPNASPIVFDILEGGVSGSPSAIIADNYEAAIALLNEFASAAKIGSIAEQKGERRQKSARPTKKEAAR